MIIACWPPRFWARSTRALIAQFKIQPIIVTLVLYIAGRGIAQLMSDGSTLVFL